MTDPITVDIWSDIACPWCYIGKRKFDKAVETFTASGENQVAIEYHSFELSPDTPVEFAGSASDFLVEHKGMPADQVEQMQKQVAQAAASAGLEFHLDILHHTNTVKAHELVHFAASLGKQNVMIERLMSAYFTEGKHVGRVDSLVELAVDVGLNADDVRRVLTHETYRADVRADQQQAAKLGIQGVPFFVLDGQYGVSGAQETQTFIEVLEQVRAKRDEVAS